MRHFLSWIWTNYQDFLENLFFCYRRVWWQNSSCLRRKISKRCWRHRNRKCWRFICALRRFYKLLHWRDHSGAFQWSWSPFEAVVVEENSFFIRSAFPGWSIFLMVSSKLTVDDFSSFLFSSDCKKENFPIQIFFFTFGLRYLEDRSGVEIATKMFVVSMFAKKM